MMRRFHSAYGIDASRAPPPLFVGAGLTDDIFPVDETLRFTIRLRARNARAGVPVLRRLRPPACVEQAEGPRAAARDDPSVVRPLRRAPQGQGAAAGRHRDHATCPKDRPSEGPFSAPAFAKLARRVVRFASAPVQSLSSTGGDPRVAAAIDPATGGVTASAADEAGTATYRLPAAKGKGILLMGAPAASAHLAVSGAAPNDAQVAARLWDVAPDGTQRLVARGLYRPLGGARDAFELHANAWRFGRGHVPKLELLGRDAPYGRPSNGTFTMP